MCMDSNSAACRALSVLVVDDSPVMRTFIRRTLDLAGLPIAAVHEAEDGRAALEVLAVESVDLVLSDINMPNMNGVELVRRIRADRRTHSVPVIIVSTDSSRQGLDTMRGLGADGYLAKPFQPELLRFEIERVTGI